ncbi:hypothetical protein GCM10009682_16160 [Luedemannella flava]|uniref:Cell division protein FtsL n=1 Tax=Luedemannella flava TaxID=349316 RepID=A0ABN2LP50_9ACTN
MIAFVIAAVAALLLAGLIGFAVRLEVDEAELRDLEEREAKLQAEWDAFHQAKRLNEAFWQARTALRIEALRQDRAVR